MTDLHRTLTWNSRNFASSRRLTAIYGRPTLRPYGEWRDDHAYAQPHLVGGDRRDHTRRLRGPGARRRHDRSPAARDWILRAGSTRHPQVLNLRGDTVGRVPLHGCRATNTAVARTSHASWTCAREGE